MKTMIIENNINSIKLYDEMGVDRIFLDLEILGKVKRQGHLNTVISTSHKLSDVKKISNSIKKADLLVRVNPINSNSPNEINTCIKDGADILMLPMFKTKNEVELFLNYVNGRVKTCLLLETAEALCRVDDIVELSGVDEIYIGLNDLHLSMNLSFMFELLSGGIVDYLAHKFNSKNIPFGFGGIAALEDGLISGEMVLKEHTRLNSSMVILSRSFKNYFNNDFSEFAKEHRKLKLKHKLFCESISQRELELNKNKIKTLVSKIIKNKNCQ